MRFEKLRQFRRLTSTEVPLHGAPMYFVTCNLSVITRIVDKRTNNCLTKIRSYLLHLKVRTIHSHLIEVVQHEWQHSDRHPGQALDRQRQERNHSHFFHVRNVMTLLFSICLGSHPPSFWVKPDELHISGLKIPW